MSRKKGRVPFAVCLMLLTALALAPSLVQAKTVLEFPSWQADEPGFAQWWRELIAAYEELHPDVEINLYRIPYDGYVDTMITRLASGNPPDILHLPARFVFSFADLGLLEPLDKFLADTDIPETWTPMQQEAMVWNGETVGLVLLVNGNCLFYNEQMLKDAGVEVPTTQEELLEAARALTLDTNGDGFVDQYGFTMTTITHPNLIAEVTGFIVGYGTNWTTPDGKLNFDDPNLIKGLEFFKRMWDEGVMPLGVNTEVARQYFFEGRAAMMLANAFVLPLRDTATAEVAENVRIAPYPAEFTPGNASNGLHIARGLSAEKQQLVWDFIYLASRPEWQQRYVELVKAPSPRAGVVSDEILRNQPEMITFMAATENIVNTVPVGLEAVYAEFQTLASDAIFAILGGEMSIPEALEQLERELSYIMR